MSDSQLYDGGWKVASIAEWYAIKESWSIPSKSRFFGEANDAGDGDGKLFLPTSRESHALVSFGADARESGLRPFGLGVLEGVGSSNSCFAPRFSHHHPSFRSTPFPKTGKNYRVKRNVLSRCHRNRVEPRSILAYPGGRMKWSLNLNSAKGFLKDVFTKFEELQKLRGLTMHWRSLLLVPILATLFLARSNAQDWPNEPSHFLGLEFGKPLVDQVKECPKYKKGFQRGEYEYAPQEKCFQTDWKPNPYAADGHGVLAKVYNLPDIGLHTQIKGINGTQVLLVDGTVEDVKDTFTPLGYDRLVALLTETYGKPVTASVPLQNSFGAKFNGDIATWRGKNLTVTVMKYYGSLNNSLIEVRTKKLDALDNAKAEREKQNFRDALK